MLSSSVEAAIGYLGAVFCPHCGAKNDAGNRFCVGCGSELAQGSRNAPGARSPRERIGAVLGTSRRARLTTAATAAAIVVAVAAFLTFEPSEDEAATGPFAHRLERVCVEKKGTIAALGRETVRQRPPDLATYAGALVAIVAEWRLALTEIPPPPEQAAEVRAFDMALLDVLIEAGALGRAVREGETADAVARAREIDLASARIDAAAENLRLEECANLSVAPVGDGQS